MRPEAAAERIAARLAGVVPAGRRCLVALAGPPGAGKSTIGEALVARLGPEAVLVPMDGFHLDNRLIEPRGLLARKGAPETFDAAGFATAMRRLAGEESVVLPTFDRTRDISIAGAIEIGPESRIAVVEGNYLLFDEPVWRDLADLWDLAVWLGVPEDELARRLTGRWLDHGLDAAAAQARAEGNDLANARRIIAARLPADLSLDFGPPQPM